LQPPLHATLIPYTTLFRSEMVMHHIARGDDDPGGLSRSDHRVEIGERRDAALERAVVIIHAPLVDVAESHQTRGLGECLLLHEGDRKSTRLNSSHQISS